LCGAVLLFSLTVLFADARLRCSGHTVISRRRFLTGVAIGLAPIGAAAHAQEYKAQQAGKVYRIGYLANTPPPPPVWEAFLRGLREFGWVEGQNIVRNAEGRYERLSDLAAELVHLRVDIIVVAGSPAPLAAKRATSTIPIVMTNAADPVTSGLVTSLGRPGGNVTGLSLLSPAVIGKQLQLLQEVVPKVNRAAVLTNPAHPARGLMLIEAETAMRPLGLQLQVIDARGPGEFDAAFSAMKRERSGALLILADPMFFGERKRLADLATRSRLPAISGVSEFADAGILMAYGASLSDLHRRAAAYVDKILKGTKPGDLPVEQPTKFSLVINLKTAKALGLTIPPSLLARADEVIQ
jgi:putative ABC transport system substrate-binding protein